MRTSGSSGRCGFVAAAGSVSAFEGVAASFATPEASSVSLVKGRSVVRVGAERNKDAYRDDDGFSVHYKFSFCTRLINEGVS